MIEQAWESAQVLFENTWEWVSDHMPELFLIVTLLVLAGAFAGIYHSLVARQQAQIDLCLRAFEYTRDQCEFIVRNRVMPIK